MSTSRRPAQSEPQVDNLPRKMRLKVLYTFDTEKKENRLSRWPHMISTPVMYLDSERTLGVVDLKTCLNSIAASSPELVATLGTNYSVYAYDYSEPDVPMVGLGILSWLLAAPNSQPYVTGLVCQNRSPLFAANVTETLEVKFALSPVPHFTQEDYLKSMTIYNTLSKQIPGNFDPTAWSAFVTANPSILSTAQSMSFESPDLSFANPRRLVDAGSNCGKDDDLQAGEETECQTNAYDSCRESVASTPALAHRVLSGRMTQESDTLPPLQNRAGGKRQQQILSLASEAGVPSPDIASSPPTEQDPIPTDTEEPIDHNSPTLPPMQEAQEESLNMSQTHAADPTLPTLNAGPAAISRNTTFADSNAPSPAADTLSGTEKKPKKKYIRKPKALTSDVPVSSDALAEAASMLPAPRKRGRPLGSTKANSQKAANDGQKRPRTGRAPGDKDTASGSEAPRTKPSSTAAVKERIGRQLVEALQEGKIPNYCGNCGAIETSTWRRVNLNINKEDGKKIDILLCNPCGLWHHAKGTMRPQEFWDSKPRDMEVETTKKPRNRKRKMSAANVPQSEPQTEVDEPINVPPPPPPPPGNLMQLLLPGVSRKIPCTPSARSAREANAEWTMAVAAGARTARSSPTREGTADSPIELEDEPEPESISRNLFGASPRGAPALEASPKIGTQQRRTSPRKSPLKPTSAAALSNKENISPASKEDRTVRQSTPAPHADVQSLLKTPDRRPCTLPKMTPQRMTPLGQSPWRSLFGMTPKSANRKSGNLGSPSPNNLERLLSQLNNISPKNRGTFGALLSPTAQRSARQNGNTTFEFDDDLFSTDIAMPSSPPAFGFSTDGQDPSSSLWSELLPSPKDPEFAELIASLEASSKDNPLLTVDFSNFIEENENLMNAMLKEQQRAPSDNNSNSS